MTEVGNPIVGQWYTRQDTGENFWVTGYDSRSGSIEIQMSDGDLDELDEEGWDSLPLDLAEASPGRTDPLADGDADTEAEAGPPRSSDEPWEDTSPFDEIDRYTERLLSKDFD